MKPDLDEIAALARRADSAGIGALWTTEVSTNPFLPIAIAAGGTQRVEFGTNIALAFTRSPMVTAVVAWDLQRLTRGRFILGLGTQVRSHNERRFSVPFTAPAARLGEQVAAIRHIWGAFNGDHKLDFHGEHYRFDLLTELFNPGPLGLPTPPIFVGALGPRMFRMAASTADGVLIHPLHTTAYLAEVALPSADAGLAGSGRDRAAFKVCPTVFAIVGSGPERDRQETYIRRQVSFYGSTPTYRVVFEHHGWEALSRKLFELMAAGDREAMVRAIPDEVLAEFTVSGETWGDVAAAARSKYQGIADRITFYSPPTIDEPFLSGLGTASRAAAGNTST